MLFLLVIYACLFNHYGSRVLFSKAIPATAVCVLLPWIYLGILRYLKWNGLFKASACVLAAGIYTGLVNSILNAILYQSPIILPAVNLAEWNDFNLNGNITLIASLSCIAVALLFAAGGVALQLKKRKAD